MDQPRLSPTNITKQEAQPDHSNATSDEDFLSEVDDSFEYNEDPFEDSDSEFQLSEEEDTIARVESDAEVRLVETLEGMDDDDAESAMMSMAIQLSMQQQSYDDWSAPRSISDWSNEASTSGAGTSTLAPRSSTAALSAAAAERRLAAADPDPFEVSSLGLETHSSEDEPLSSIKGKIWAKKQNTRRSTCRIKPNHRQPRLGKTGSSQHSTRQEEMALRKQLGRKLTHVRIFPSCAVVVIA